VSKHIVYAPPVVKIRGRTALFYAVNLVLLWISLLRRALKSNAVVVTSNPILALPLVHLRKRNWSVIFDYVDDISGLAIEYVPGIFAAPVAKLVSKIVRAVARRSDIVIVASRYLERRVRNFSSKPPVYIPNGVFIKKFKDASYRKQKAKVGYVGGLYEWAGVDDFISTYEDVSKAIPEVEYHIYGFGSKAESIIDLAKKREGIFFHGTIPYHEVPSIMKSFSVGVIPFIKTALTDSACPLKLFEYWAAEVPVVSRDINEVNTLAAGACLLFKEHADFVDAIVRLLSDKGISDNMVEEGKRRVADFDWSDIATTYGNLILRECKRILRYRSRSS
jgi:glycosyltransferase involved in cell wall biosynthesis